jgi:7-cyano-7-deazaguanine synthase in queuosine biosynthesis
MSAYPVLSKEQYIKRHDSVHATTLQYMQRNRVKIRQLWHKHIPESVETSQEGKVTILWNPQMQTVRTLSNNKPDIINRDNEKGTCVLIDVAIPGDRNVIKKGAEKILK